MDNTEFLLQEIEGLEKSLKEANDIIKDYRQREEQINYRQREEQINYNASKIPTSFDSSLATQAVQTLL